MYKNKKAQKRNAPKGLTVTLIILAIVTLILGIVAGVMWMTGTGFFAEAGKPGTTNNNQGTGGCEVAPSISTNVLNGLSKSTSVTTGTQAIIDGYYHSSVPSTLQKGSVVQLLYNASNYIDVYGDKFILDCGVNLETQYINATDAITLEIKDGDTTLTDSASGGANNASNVSDGGSDTLKVLFTGIDKKTSGDLVYVVELSESANVSDVTLSLDGKALKEVDTPTFHIYGLSNPYEQAFVIPAIANAVEEEFKLVYSAKSGKNIYGAVYTTAYSQQAFVDTDGTFTIGVEDSDGTAKYEDTFDYDFVIENAN